MSQTTITFKDNYGNKNFEIVTGFGDTKWKLETDIESKKINSNLKIDIYVTIPPFMTIYFDCDDIPLFFSEERFLLFTKAEKQVDLRGTSLTTSITNFHLSDPRKFLEKSDLDDICLIIEDQKLHLNKTILSYASEVFKKMFFGEFKESKSNEIVMEGKSINRFIDFLSTFYDLTDPLKFDEFVKLSVLRAINLYPLYCEYLMKKHIEYCERVFCDFMNELKSDWFDSDHQVSLILQIGITAEKFENVSILDRIMRILSCSKSSKFKRDYHWMEFTETTRYKVLDWAFDRKISAIL